jgi:hypothetical protein
MSSSQQPSTCPPISHPIVSTTITSHFHPIAPQHIGELQHNIFYSDWKSSLFKNYDKMHTAGTWSTPILRSMIPSNKNVLCSRIAFKVKDTEIQNTYKLHSCTCADGSIMKEHIDYSLSYSPVSSIDSIRLLLAISAAKNL